MAEAIAQAAVAEAIAQVAVAEAIAQVAVAEAIARVGTTDDKEVETTGTPATADDHATARVGTEADPKATEETIGSEETTGATASGTGEATTEEAAEPSSEGHRTGSSVVPKASDPGTLTTDRRGTSEHPAGLSEKTSKRTWWIER